MPTDTEFEALTKTVNQQKGELLYLHAVNAALVRALPKDIQAATVQHLSETVDGMRQHLLFSDVPEEVVNSFDHFTKASLSLKPKAGGSKSG